MHLEQNMLYKLPKPGTHKAQLLVQLLNGNVIRNSKAKNDLDTANPATAMSQLRLDDHWDELIERKSIPSRSSTGHEVYVKEYYITAKTIMELKDSDPRIEKYLEYHRKS